MRTRGLPIGGVSGRERVLRKRMQDVGEEELLMLLLVMKPDLENTRHLRQPRLLDGGDEALDRFVDVRPERGDVSAIRSRDEPALGSRVARAGGHVIRVEEIGEPFVEDPIAGKPRHQQELLQEPGAARTARKAARQMTRASFGGACGTVAVSPSSRLRRRTGDEVAGGMPHPGLEKSNGVR